MKFRMVSLGTLAFLVALGTALGDPPTAKSAKEALQPFNVLIGSWRGTGTPVGSQEEIQKGFWQESLAWEWQFKKGDAWLKLDIDKGKYYTGGELRFIADKDQFELTLRTVDKETTTYLGKLQNKNLVLEREGKVQTERLVFTLLHSNRFLYRYEVKPAEKNLFSKKYGVGATKEGEAFAGGDDRPECIVSGGLGTMPVMHMGKTYHVCCSGCRSEFLENAQKYIKEFEEKKKSKK